MKSKFSRGTLVILAVCATPVCVLAESGWTLDRVLEAVEARERAIEMLEMTLEVSERLLEGHRQHYEAQYEAKKQFAPIMGREPPPRPRPYEQNQYRAHHSYRLHYQRGRNGLQRFEQFYVNERQEKRVEASFLYDGQRWWTLPGSGEYATVSEGQTIPRDLRYVGLDYEWRDGYAESTNAHSLGAALRHFHASGFVTMGRGGNDQDIVTIVVRRPLLGFPNDQVDRRQEDVLFFKPELGMALVGYESRWVFRMGQEFVDVQTAGTWYGTWSGFKEISPGLWVPNSFRARLEQGVFFPRTDRPYPPGFDFEKASSTLHFRVERFAVMEVSAQVLELKTNQEFGPDTFKPRLPENGYVFDDANNKVYHAKSMTPVSLDEEMRRALAASRRTDYGVWLWIVAANLALFAGLGAWLWLRRMRAGRHGSAARPSG